MKKQNTPTSQLEIFQSKNDSSKIQRNKPVSIEPKGKQVFLENRQAIYERILNRKME